MRKKTEGLAFPVDALAAMRELSELDRPQPPEKPPTAEKHVAENPQEGERRTDVPVRQRTDVPRGRPADVVESRRTDVPTYRRTISARTVDELMDCELPSTEDAARRFIAHAAQIGKPEPFTFKAPTGVESLVRRLVKEAWRNPIQKQSLFTRGLMLVLYERYTGRELVDFREPVNFDDEGQ